MKIEDNPKFGPTTELEIDHNRYGVATQTGIYVRAKIGDTYRSADISELTKDSLLVWLRSRGGENVWAENVVGQILGHGPLHPDKDQV